MGEEALQRPAGDALFQIGEALWPLLDRPALKAGVVAVSVYFTETAQSSFGQTFCSAANPSLSCDSDGCYRRPRTCVLLSGHNRFGDMLSVSHPLCLGAVFTSA